MSGARRQMGTRLAGLACLFLAACGSTAASPQTTPTPSAIPTSPPTTPPPTTFDVTSYGAIGDGSSDNTAAFASAIAAADAAGGGTVSVPAGRFAFTTAQTPTRASIYIQSSAAITLRGAGRDQTFLIEAVKGKGLLSITVDSTVISDLTLDTQTNDGGAAIFVRANHTSLLRARVLGGTRAFALYYAGPAAATRDVPVYNVGNTIDDLELNDRICDDGLSWSFQRDSSISNVVHTGSRLALYVDVTTTVTNYRYTPGAQQCSARNAFWLTPPADNVTIINFSSGGEGGKVGIIGPDGAGKVATNVTIRGLTMTGSGYHLAIGDVRNLVLEDCNLGSNSIVIAAQVVAQGAITNCTFAGLIRSSAPSASVAMSVSAA